MSAALAAAAGDLLPAAAVAAAGPARRTWPGAGGRTAGGQYASYLARYLETKTPIWDI